MGEQELDCRTGEGSAVQQDESKDGYLKEVWALLLICVLDKNP